MINGVSKEGNNNKFYMRDFRNARRFEPSITPPRQKFQGYVDFVFNPALVEFLSDSLVYRTQISSLVQTATLPSVGFKTETKNQYNMKRIVNTGVEYTPIDISVIDTVNNEWLTLFMKYFSYLYMNPRNKTVGEREVKGYAPAAETLTRPSQFGSDTFDSNAAGLNIGPDANFFERIDMVLYHGQTGVQYSMFRPMMTSFKTSEINYSESGFMTYNLSFEYESFSVYNKTNFMLGQLDKARFENVENFNLPGGR